MCQSLVMNYIITFSTLKLLGFFHLSDSSKYLQNNYLLKHCYHFNVFSFF